MLDLGCEYCKFDCRDDDDDDDGDVDDSGGGGANIKLLKNPSASVSLK